MLKSGDHEAIVKMFESLRNEARMILDGVIQLVYFMRGSIQYDDMMFRTPGERQAIEEFIQSRLEAQKDSPHPVY